MGANRRAVGHPWALGATVGLLTAAVGLGVAQLVAAFVGELASPVVAVGEAAIDASPGRLKEFAIRTFGTSDKLALLIGIGVLLALYAVVMGILALRRRWVGYAGLLGFGLIGVLAAVTRPTSDALSAFPSVAGALSALWALQRLMGMVVVSTGPSPVAPSSSGGPEPGAPEASVALDRRRFLRTGLALGGAAAAAGIGSAFAGTATSKAVASRAAVRIPPPSERAPVPAGTRFDVPGLSPFYTPNANFYRVDTALIVPKVTAEDWTLRIHGMVDREVRLDYRGLLALPLVERDVTLTCVSNEIGGGYAGNARWVGALLAPILDEASVRTGAAQLVSRSADGFTIGTPTAVVRDGRDAMLAVGMNGQPLPIAHGFPVRMVVPGLYGYVSATKWVVDMELTTFEAYDAYWVRRGWAQQAPIKTMSRIDTPTSGAAVRAGRVPVAGVAWAQHTGIAGVEIRVDRGPWQPARLPAQDTIDTWRQWLFEWDASPGRHLLAVRATDDSGYVQTGQDVAPFPNGATGWHTIAVNVG